MKKSGIGLCISILLSILFPVCTNAAENSAFIEAAVIDQTKVTLLCSDIVAEEEEKIENVTISLGGQSMAVISLETAEQNRYPVTYYCLVDVSGSMKESQMAQAKAVLQKVLEGMQDGDNMVIGTLGNQTDMSGFLSDKTQIADAIQALAPGREDTNLYAGIVESIGQLQTQELVNPRKCLLILSDGRDDQKTGITKEEAENAIEESSIPVFTIATLKESPSADSLEDAKLLGSFARLSTGGRHYVPVVEDITGEEIGADIYGHLNQGINVTIDTSEVDSFGEKDILLLRAIYTSENGIVLEDTLELYAEDVALLRKALEEAQESKEEAEANQKTEASDESELAEEIEDSSETSGEAQTSGRGDSLVWILMASGILLAAMVLLLVAKKKKKAKEAKKIVKEDSSAQEAAEAVDAGKNVLQEAVREFEEEAVIPEGAYELKLYAIGYKHLKLRIVLEPGKDFTIGRNDKADIVLNPDDVKLSSVHCKVRWENEKLYVRDMNSTNGTFVNGIPIRTLGRVAVHEGETIRMGSYEYRIGRLE